MESVKKYIPDQKKSFDYLSQIVKEVDPVFHKICEKIDLFKGKFYCELPSNTYLDRLHDFDLNGIFPATDLIKEEKILENDMIYIPKCIFTTRGRLKDELFQYLSEKKNHYAIFISYNQVKIFNYNSSRSEISESMCKIAPHVKFAIIQFNSNLENLKTLTHPDEVINGVEKIHVSAYDGDAYLSWEKVE